MAIFADLVWDEDLDFRQKPDTWELTKAYTLSFYQKKGGKKKVPLVRHN